MKQRQIKLPGPDHPISIEHNPARVVVSVAGQVVADTRNALTLREAAYPPVQYIPREDADFSQLERSDHATTAFTKAIAAITAFPLKERSPSTPCGYTRIRFLLLSRLRSMLRSIPSGLMQLK
jgi:uncharacterized protein (DUF427 family)